MLYHWLAADKEFVTFSNQFFNSAASSRKLTVLKV